MVPRLFSCQFKLFAKKICIFRRIVYLCRVIKIQHMIKNLEFNSLCNEVTGHYKDIQFTMSVKVIGDEEPELYFNDEQYYTLEGNPRLIQPQMALNLKEALADEIYASEEYETMLREWDVAGYDYSQHNDY